MHGQMIGSFPGPHTLDDNMPLPVVVSKESGSRHCRPSPIEHSDPVKGPRGPTEVKRAVNYHEDSRAPFPCFLALPLTSHMPLKVFNLLVPQFPHEKNGGNSSTYFLRLKKTE